MTDKLPPNLLALFQPRPPLRWLNPSDHAPEDRRTAKVDGVAGFLAALHEKKEEAKDEEWTESHLERADREKLEKQKKQKWLVTEGVKQLYKPSEDSNVRGDAFKTLFVGRLPYDASTKDLENQFGRFGPIERIRIVQDRSGKPGKDGKSRGYAFVLFDREADCKGQFSRV
ncbi:hypothetical protein M409DRAFT_37459 [Zasmidium cellare ATCC 36951]|uniref:RRM domain-containing protein n=1 Tax=Zasmidium cellare ATCC 36951 TaxID=1080233 RepID=A0A6A6C4U8_ZASCE|nr:uncharacterized protein M409DRAFT_37459 [Zasmidium cellare ATCC 36951]KAF2162197.1 hypothetical protein M409DRAFT_37459 [Zasmidium cellare ATCC 36951]